jgi:hypothetical protein
MIASYLATERDLGRIAVNADQCRPVPTNADIDPLASTLIGPDTCHSPAPPGCRP